MLRPPKVNVDTGNDVSRDESRRSTGEFSGLGSRTMTFVGSRSVLVNSEKNDMVRHGDEFVGSQSAPEFGTHRTRGRETALLDPNASKEFHSPTYFKDLPTQHSFDQAPAERGRRKSSTLVQARDREAIQRHSRKVISSVCGAMNNVVPEVSGSGIEDQEPEGGIDSSVQMPVAPPDPAVISPVTTGLAPGGSVGNSIGTLTSLSSREIQEPPPPLMRVNHTTFFHEGRLYLFGGRQGTGQSNYVQGLFVFVPGRSSWVEVPTKGTPPPKRGDHSAVVLGEKLYVYGGRKHMVLFHDLYVFDFGTGSWSEEFFDGTSGPGALWGHHACATGTSTTEVTNNGAVGVNRLSFYVCGGVHVGERRHLMHRYNATFKYWKPIAGPGDIDPNGLYKCSMAVHGKDLFVLGLATMKQHQQAAEGKFTTNILTSVKEAALGEGGGNSNSPVARPLQVSPQRGGKKSGKKSPLRGADDGAPVTQGALSVAATPQPPKAIHPDGIIRVVDLETLIWREIVTTPSIPRETLTCNMRLISHILCLKYSCGHVINRKGLWIFPVLYSNPRDAVPGGGGSSLASALPSRPGGLTARSSRGATSRTLPRGKTPRAPASSTGSSGGAGPSGLGDPKNEKLHLLCFNLKSHEWSLTPVHGPTTNGVGGQVPITKAMSNNPLPLSGYETKYSISTFSSGTMVMVGGVSKADKIFAKLVPNFSHSHSTVAPSSKFVVPGARRASLLLDAGSTSATPNLLAPRGLLGEPPTPGGGTHLSNSFSNSQSGSRMGFNQPKLNQPQDPDLESLASGRSSALSNQTKQRRMSANSGTDSEDITSARVGRKRDQEKPTRPCRPGMLVPVHTPGGPFHHDQGAPLAVIQKGQVEEWEGRYYKDLCNWVSKEAAKAERETSKEENRRRRAKKQEVKEKQQQQLQDFVSRNSGMSAAKKAAVERAKAEKAAQPVPPHVQAQQDRQARLDGLKMGVVLHDVVDLAHNHHLSAAELTKLLCLLRWELVKRYVLSGQATLDERAERHLQERRLRKRVSIEAPTLQLRKRGLKDSANTLKASTRSMGMSVTGLSATSMDSREAPAGLSTDFNIGTSGAVIASPGLAVLLHHRLMGGAGAESAAVAAHLEGRAGAQRRGSSSFLSGFASALTGRVKNKEHVHTTAVACNMRTGNHGVPNLNLMDMMAQDGDPPEGGRGQGGSPVVCPPRCISPY